jgi:hypothetical protein
MSIESSNFDVVHVYISLVFEFINLMSIDNLN